MLLSNDFVVHFNNMLISVLNVFFFPPHLWNTKKNVTDKCILQ